MTVVWLDASGPPPTDAPPVLDRGDLSERQVRAALGPAAADAALRIVPLEPGQRSGAVVAVEGHEALTLHIARSGLERLLPEVLVEADDGTLSGLLRLIQHLQEPLRAAGERVEELVDPACCPDALLPWLCSWLGEPVPEAPAATLRARLRSGGLRRGARGTAGAFAAALEDALGVPATVRLASALPTSRLGALPLGRAHLMPAHRRALTLVVTLVAPDAGEAARARLLASARRVARRHLPAHTGLILRFKEHEDGA